MILDNGFEISALQMFYLDRPTSEEFFEVYKVRNFFGGLIEFLFLFLCKS